MTMCRSHQWNKEILTPSILPGVQGVRPLVSGDSTLHGKGPQNDQQQTGNFGVHSLIFTAKENRNYNFYSILSYFDHIYKI